MLCSLLRSFCSHTNLHPHHHHHHLTPPPLLPKRAHTMFDTCFVRSVVVSEHHKNKRPFSLSLSQSWNKRDKHIQPSQKWKNHSQNRIKEQQPPSDDRFQNGIIIFLKLYSSPPSSSQATETVHFCEICVRLLYQTTTFCQLSHLRESSG